MAAGIRDGKGRILKTTDPLFTEIAEHYPHGNYTSLCSEFGVEYNLADTIKSDLGNRSIAALKLVLNKYWLIKGKDVTKEKLESALTNTGAAGLIHIVTRNFAKYAVKEESSEGDESDVQANNQATASRAAGQSIAMTGNTSSVTDNFDTGNEDRKRGTNIPDGPSHKKKANEYGNGEDRKRRTDEPNAGPSHKKKANENTMTTRHRKILEKSAPDLLKDLRAADVLPFLVRDDVITTDHADEVKTIPTKREKVAALLDILPGRGDRAYASFLNSLNEAKAAHLYESMKKCEEAYDQDQEQDVPTSTSQGAEHLTSSDQPSRGGNTQSGSITITASGSATVQNNTVTGQVNNYR